MCNMKDKQADAEMCLKCVDDGFLTQETCATALEELADSILYECGSYDLIVNK